MLLNRARRSASADDGITLIETVVAMLVFTIFAVIAARFLLTTLDVDRSNTRRVAAANLAAQQIELVRGTPVLDLADGLATLPTQPVLAGTTYTLQQDVSFVAGQSGGSVCSSTSNSLTYKKVTVTVTWPDMGSTKPVRLDTLKVLGLGPNEADVRKGAAAVGVIDETGQPQTGVLVSLTPSGRSATTGVDGCAVFPNLDVTITHTATLSATGYVDQQGDAAPASVINVIAGKVVRTSLTYARRGALTLNLSAPAGYPLPDALGATVDGSLLTPTTSRAFPRCAPGASSNCVTQALGTLTAAALFPASYTVWPGTCADARPTTTNAVAVSSGGAFATSGELGAVRVELKNYNFTGSVFAVHVSTPGSCPAGESFQLTRLPPTPQAPFGVLVVSLPPGTWKLSTTGDANDPNAGQYTGTQSVTAGAVTTVVL